jgi:predicted RNase H-like nuclease (RuvC/YqgF family)
VERLQQENEELKRKLHDLEVQSYDWVAKRQELEARLKQAKQLNERLQGLLGEKTKENENLKIKVIRKVQGVPAQ